MVLTDSSIQCGLVAKSFFNDTFHLYQIQIDEKGEETRVEKFIKDKQIAWSSDLEFKFNNIKESTIPSQMKNAGTTYQDTQWTDMTDGK